MSVGEVSQKFAYVTSTGNYYKDKWDAKWEQINADSFYNPEQLNRVDFEVLRMQLDTLLEWGQEHVEFIKSYLYEMELDLDRKSKKNALDLIEDTETGEADEF